MLKKLLNGIKSYGRAHKVIAKYDLWGYLFIPGAISFAFFGLLFVTAWFVIPTLSASAVDSLPDWAQFGFVVWIIGFLMAAAILLAGVFTMKYVVLIVLSPVLSHLSEITEKKIRGIELPEMNFKAIMSDIFRALKINIRNVFLELFISIGVFLFGLIPFVGVAAPVLSFITQSYYFGFGLIDFTLERKRFTTGETIKWVREHRGETVGLGGASLLIGFVPLVGWFIGPTYGTVAATLVSLDTLMEEGHPSMEGAASLQI